MTEGKEVQQRTSEQLEHERIGVPVTGPLPRVQQDGLEVQQYSMQVRHLAVSWVLYSRGVSVLVMPLANIVTRPAVGPQSGWIAGIP